MKLNKKQWMIAIIVLIVATLACSIVAAASVKDTLTGFGDSFKTKFSSGTTKAKEWQGKYFSKQIIVNALLLVGILYLVLMLLPSFFPDFKMPFMSSYSYGNSNNIIFFSVIGILALIISVNAIGPNEYMWEKQWWVDGKLYLLGDPNCEFSAQQETINDLQIKQNSYYKTTKNADGTEVQVVDESPVRSLGKKLPLGVVDSAETQVKDYKTQIELLSQEQQEGRKFCYTSQSKLAKAQKPASIKPTSKEEILGWGILRGTRLFVFIGSLLVFFLLFKTLGTEGMDNSVRWILTIMFAANNAHTGMPKSQFLHLAYWTLIILIYKTFAKTSGEGTTGKAMAAALSFGIVNTMAASAFPQYNLGFSMFQSANFITNFMIGWITGYVIGSMQDENNNFIKNSFKKLGSIGKDWGIKAGKVILKGPGKAILKGAGWAVRKITPKIIQNMKVNLKMKMSIFFGDMRELKKLSEEERIKAGPTKIDPDLRWGEFHTHSRCVDDKRTIYREYITKINAWVSAPDEATKKSLLKEVEAIEEKMKEGNYTFIPGRKPTMGNPTYDPNPKNSNRHKSINGILSNTTIDDNVEMTKRTWGL